MVGSDRRGGYAELRAVSDDWRTDLVRWDCDADQSMPPHHSAIVAAGRSRPSIFGGAGAL